MAQEHDQHRPEPAVPVDPASQPFADAISPPFDPDAPFAWPDTEPDESPHTPALSPTEPDSRPFPDYETDAEIDAFWKGVSHGIRVGGGLRADDEKMLRYRTDGWTPERQRAFLLILSMTGSVTEACGDIGMSRESAYRLRRRPEGRLFARLWDAARLIARDRLADEAVERAMKGTEETLVYHGKEVGSHRKHDNRHLQWTLSRLDRETAENADRAAPARRAAQAFDALVEKLDSDPEEAAEMLAMIDEEEEARSPGVAPADSEAELLARFEEMRELRRIEESDPADIDTADLDPAQSDEWTELQWARAERSGLADGLEKEGFWAGPATQAGEEGN